MGNAYQYPPALMRTDEAARYVGLSRTTFLAHKGKPTAVRPSRGVVAWRRADLDRWIDSLAKDPNAAAFNWEEALCQGANR